MKNNNYSKSLSEMQASSHFGGANGAYLESLYESWLQDPSSVAKKWQSLFSSLPKSGDAHNTKEPIHSEVREEFRKIAKLKDKYIASTAGDAGQLEHERKQVKVLNLISAYRTRGHQHATLDPLHRKEPEHIPDLTLEFHGLSPADLDTEFDTGSLFGPNRATLAEILDILKATYCGSVGAELMHIIDMDERRWLQQRLEILRGKPKYDPEFKQYILERLTAAEGLERYLHTKYVGQKRFSLEGAESMIPMLDCLCREASADGIHDIVIGMAHRGRLNVLVNIMGKNPSDLFSEFEGKNKFDNNRSGDVKYHMGFSSDIQWGEDTTHLTLAFNPSHLEIVAPVVEGSTRARQDTRGDMAGDKVLAINIHGDAAFSGQGVVMETFNMSQSRGFSTKGTVHIVVNNQIGFTTSNQEDTRSTYYCTDVAKMVNAPIFHVNGDDPEAVMQVTQLALQYRMRFKKDVVIDLMCYRRHGHNEADEPSATQPMMYKKIKALNTTRNLYAQQLMSEAVITEEDDKVMVNGYRAKMDNGECAQTLIVSKSNDKDLKPVDWSVYDGVEWDVPCNTYAPVAQIQAMSQAICTLPDNHPIHPRVSKIYADRVKMAQGEIPIDWGYAETMAYATLLDDGFPVRLSGQDCGRGTFFHRHAVLHSQADGTAYIPLRHLNDKQAKFTVIDSLLSEEAVLAFEYGYATTSDQTLVIWEAQFGDFANGAQVVIDQFISSGEQKWDKLCGLTLLLPHGYEGQGPEHSSARLERFMQLCAQQNIQVCYPTTPAQVFHLLRRQIIRPRRKPLVIMSPKSLLRHKRAVSELSMLSEGAFMPVLPDRYVEDKDAIERVVMCSGKVYYDLLEYREANNITDTALVRVEQLYPFPEALFADIISDYPNAQTYAWCQEEPRNQGAWYSIQHYIRNMLNETVHYIGRKAAAAPAAGSAKQHAKEQALLIEQAFMIESEEE